MSNNRVKIIYGTFPIPFIPKDQLDEVLQLLEKHNVRDLDTARVYPDGEKCIGELNLPAIYTVHTKAVTFQERSLSKESILKSIGESLSLLKTDKVETFYLHCPDPETPIEETLETVNELYKEGKFKHFGLSNYPASEVRKIHECAASKGYVLPTVYQGNYNAVSRKIEKDLFPVLRELKIAFYAYSPIAGGFLARTPQEIEEGAEGRFDKSTQIGQMYHKLYNRPSLVKALGEWGTIAEKAGVTKSALAYRWIEYHSALKREHGDAVIIGGKTAKQVGENLEAIAQGPLSEDVARDIEKLWELVKDEAPIDNYSY